MAYHDLTGPQHLKVLASIDQVICNIYPNHHPKRLWLLKVWYNLKLLKDSYEYYVDKTPLQIEKDIKESLTVRRSKRFEPAPIPSYDKKIARKLHELAVSFVELLVLKNVGWDVSVLKNYTHSLVCHMPVFYHIAKMCTGQVLERQNLLDKLHFHQTIDKGKRKANRNLLLTKLRCLFNEARRYLRNSFVQFVGIKSMFTKIVYVNTILIITKSKMFLRINSHYSQLCD